MDVTKAFLDLPYCWLGQTLTQLVCVQKIAAPENMTSSNSDNDLDLQDIDNALVKMSIRDGWKERELLEDDLYVQ